MDFLTWQVGDARITCIVELTSSSIGNHILPQATPEALRAIQWIDPFIDDDARLLMSFHSLVIESMGQTIVVDTCIGDDKQRNYPRWNMMQTGFLDDFNAAGFRTEAVDHVLCTHMHVDHVGWNTYRTEDGWAPTFPNARYLYAQEEWSHWSAMGSELEDEYGPIIEDSILPIFDQGLADLVPSDAAVNDEVRLEPTPGHTPGHVSVHISSRGEEAIITGDMIHHPCQIAHPEWSTTADADQDAAAATRWRFLDQYADRPVLVVGTHFAGPTAGHVRRDGKVYRLDE